MKKKTFLVSALSVFLLALSACDMMVKPTSSSDVPSSSSSQPVESSSKAEESSSDVPVSSSEEASSSDSGSSSSQTPPAPVEYTITFASNGGTGSMAAVTKNQGEQYALPACGFTKEGYHFDYWQVGNDATHRAVGYQFVVNGNVTVTAQWAQDEPPAPTEYTVTYAAGEGTGTMNPVVVDAGSEHTLLPCGFTREGYHFDYWQVGNDAAHKAAGDKITVNGDVTVTAKWAQDEPAPVKTLVSIDVANTKTEYTVGDEFDNSALTVTGNYSDETQEVIPASGYTVTGFDSSAAVASQELTVAVKETTISKKITISIVEPTPAFVPGIFVSDDNWETQTKVDLVPGTSAGTYVKENYELHVGESFYVQAAPEKWFHFSDATFGGAYSTSCFVAGVSDNLNVAKAGKYTFVISPDLNTFIIVSDYDQEDYVVVGIEGQGSKSLTYNATLGAFVGSVSGVAGKQVGVAIGETQYLTVEDKLYLHEKSPLVNNLEYSTDKYLIKRDIENAQIEVYLGDDGAISVFLETQIHYYVVGVINSVTKWAATDYELKENTTKAGEYLLDDYLALKNEDEIKVMDNLGNYYPAAEAKKVSITEDGNYQVYFRPAGDGGEGWYEGYLYTEKQVAPITDTYVLYKNGDTDHPIALTQSGDALTTKVTVTRGDYFTATKNGDPFALTADGAAGNNVKVLTDKLTVLTGSNQQVDIWLHTDSTVWLFGYVENEYFLTIGTNSPVQLTQNDEPGKGYEYVATGLDVKKDDAISVMHDQQPFAITRKTGENNISTLDLLIHNDCDSADVYVDVVNTGHPIWVSGYQEAPVTYTYYIEKIHGESVSDKIPLTKSSPSDITASGADDQYEYEYTTLMGGDFIKFYYSTDSGASYHQFGNIITIEDGQNLNYTAEDGKLVIIADRGEATKLYLKIKDSNYSVRLAGYSKVVIFTIGDTPVALSEDEGHLVGDIAAAGTSDAWRLEIDRREVTINAKGDAHNNVVTNAGVTTVIRPITSTTHVDIDPYYWIWCDGYYDLYDVYVGETKVASGIHTDGSAAITAAAGATISLKINGGANFADVYVKTPGANNVKATNDQTKLLVIKGVEDTNLWINYDGENDHHTIWLEGYGLEYNIQVGKTHYIMTKSDESEKGSDTWDEQYKLLNFNLVEGLELIFNKDYNTKLAISSASGNLARNGSGVITAITTFDGSDIYLKRYGENWVVWASCDDSYYLRGGLNDWESVAAYRFTKCTGGEAKVDGKDQYSLKNVVVTGTGDDLNFKAFSIDTYLPDGDDLSFPSAGTYDIYFAPEGGVSFKDWTDFDERGYFYLAKHPEPQSLAVVVSGTVTEGNCVSGSNIAITLTYDDASHEAVAADAEGIKYTLNGGEQITYATLVATPLNATAQLRAIYRGVTSDPVAITVVEYVNNYTSVAIKDTAGTADYNGGALFVGDHYQTTATGVKQIPAEEPTDSFVWSSSDETVATVTQAGYIVAVGAGTATITLASNANPSTVKDTCVITVSEHTYFTAKINDEGDAISFDPIENSTSWVSHSEINFEAGDTLAIYYDGVKKTYTAAVSAEDHNNLDGTEGILTAGSCVVYITPTSETAGTIWVKGYARVTIGAASNSYVLERDFVKNEYYAEHVNATAADVVTVVMGGQSFTPLTASTGANNVEVVSSQLKVRQTVENMTIYVHDDKSVWLDGYVQPLNPVTNYNFSTEIDPGEGKYIFVHSWSESGSRTSYVHDGVVGVIENATGYLVGASTTNVESNAYPESSDETYRTANRYDLNADTIVYQLTGEPAVYNAYITWRAPATYSNLIGYKNNGQENFTGLACGDIVWKDSVPYRQFTYENDSVSTNDTVTIAELISEAYQPITSNISFENNVNGKMTLSNGVVTFLFDGEATLYIKYGKSQTLIYAAYTEDTPTPTVKIKFTADYNAGYGNAIYIAGTMNSWSAQRMSYNNDDNVWEIEIDVAPGAIEYKFIKADYNDINKNQKWENDRATTSKNREYTVTTAETVASDDLSFPS